MKEIITVLVAVATLAVGSLAGPGDWAMIQKDSSHTGFSEQGPRPPLRRAWFVRSGDPEGSSFTTWPVTFGETVYARSGPGVMAVAADTGKRRWYISPKGGSEIVSPAVDDRALYIPVPPDLILALDRHTGHEIWRFQAEGELEVSPTLHEGKLYFGSIRTNSLYCLNATDGSLIWKAASEFRADGIPVTSEGLVIFTEERLRPNLIRFRALNAATGQEVWVVEQEEANSSPSILEDKVIIGGGDFFAYALDVKTGKEVWKSPVEDKFSVRNSPAIAFGDVFLVDRIGNAYRLDGKTGARKWFLPDLEATYEQSFPVIAGKTLFIGGGSGRINAIDTDTGKLVWSEDVGGRVYSGAADSERFYFGVRNENEGLYAYEHDPTGNLAKPKNPSTSKSVLQALLIVLVILGAILLIVRRMRKSAR